MKTITTYHEDHADRTDRAAHMQGSMVSRKEALYENIRLNSQ